jgi:hypothetical protein
MKHDAMPTGPSHQGGVTTLMLIDPGHENFDSFLGYVLDDYLIDPDPAGRAQLVLRDDRFGVAGEEPCAPRCRKFGPTHE